MALLFIYRLEDPQGGHASFSGADAHQLPKIAEAPTKVSSFRCNPCATVVRNSMWMRFLALTRLLFWNGSGQKRAASRSREQRAVQEISRRTISGETQRANFSPSQSPTAKLESRNADRIPFSAS